METKVKQNKQAKTFEGYITCKGFREMTGIMRLSLDDAMMDAVMLREDIMVENAYARVELDG